MTKEQFRNVIRERCDAVGRKKPSQLRGKRTFEEMWRAHRARSERVEELGELSLMDCLLDVYIDEINRRGGETEIVGERDVNQVAFVERCKGVSLVRAKGWRYYSRRFGSRHVSIAYLCGFDDSRPWAIRVPGTVTRVATALEKIEPSGVKRARQDGLRVLRQGDVYAVERRVDGSQRSAEKHLPESHRWDSEMRMLRHDHHSPVHVPFPCRFFVQGGLNMDRSSRQRGRDAVD